MDSRSAILRALREAAVPVIPKADLSALGVRFPDPVRQYTEALAAVGGRCLRARDLAEAAGMLSTLPWYASARAIASVVPGMPGMDPSVIIDPHDLDGLDGAILPGELAVAENGAVWIDGRSLPHRALVVVPEHLVLVVDANDVVNDMHEALRRLAERDLGYGTFVCGPSKTADIEQALVTGAHGARSCTVFLVG